MPHVVEVDQGREVVDRDVLARTTGYSVETIRKRLRPLRYDSDTGRAVYDRAEALQVLRWDPGAPARDELGRFVAGAGIQPRPDRRGPRRATPRRRRGA